MTRAPNHPKTGSKHRFELASEFITLDSRLKAVGIAPSGAAKAMVAGGEVQVNGATELRKTCKIRVGQMVYVRGHAGAVEVRAAVGAMPE